MMSRSLLAFTLVLSAAALHADNAYIVYGKGEYSLVDAHNPAAKPSQPSRAILLSQLQSLLSRPSRPLDTRMSLGAPPVQNWGKVVTGAAGRLEFSEAFHGGFLVHVQLEGLAPGHDYRLCLNGNPQLVGNERLTDPVPGNPEEKYYDFFTAKAGTDGRFDAVFAIALPAGPYDVRFYVKDTTDHTIFLYHDYFRFRVE